MTVSLTTPPHAVPESLRIAREIVDSDPVLRVFASCEWQELGEDGKLWVSAIVAEARRRCIQEIRAELALKPGAGQQCQGNVKPAPFAITPAVVARVLEVAAAPAAPLNFPNPMRLAIKPKEERHVRPAGRPAPCKTFVLPATCEPERRSDAMYRHAKDRAARELEAPVDTTLAAGRLALIRETAAKLGQREKIALPGPNAPAPRLPLGAPAPHKRPLPPLPADLRRAALQGAIAFLKARFILVTAADRESQIPRYRVSGRRDSMLAHDVIAFAEAKGFEVPA